jgi:hypothetical protein
MLAAARVLRIALVAISVHDADSLIRRVSARAGLDPCRAGHEGSADLYRAVTTQDTLALIETPSGLGQSAEGGPNSLRRWTRPDEDQTVESGLRLSGGP